MLFGTCWPTVSVKSSEKPQRGGFWPRPELVPTLSPGTNALREVAVGSGFHPPAGGGAGRSRHLGPELEMVFTMLGYPKAGLSLFLLYLVPAAALLHPQPLR